MVLLPYFKKNMANCKKRKVVKTNFSKNIEREANSSKNMVNYSKNMYIVANCSMRKMVEANCCKNV